MDCKKAKQTVFLFTDDEMEEAALQLLRRHLEACPECARHAEYVRRLILLVRQRCCRQAAPPALRVRILARVRSVRCEE